MKKFFLLLLCLIALAFIVSYFLPSIRKNEVTIDTTFPNIVSSTFEPRSWIKWDSLVREAWQKDSAACSFREDTALHLVTIEIPGRKITVTRVSYLFYRLDEILNGHASTFIFSMNPYELNSQDKTDPKLRITYAEDSRWLYKIFPSLNKNSFAERTFSGLSAYLESPALLYGFPIELRQVSDSLFLTRKKELLTKDLFQQLPILFDSLESYARQNQISYSARNFSFARISPDSLEIRTGINIGRKTEGDYLHNFMQLPGWQYLAITHFEGAFSDKSRAYAAMEKYLLDHRLVKTGVPYERYLSPLPHSDSSFIKMDLCCPIRN